jgi:hypothetical protein
VDFQVNDGAFHYVKKAQQERREMADFLFSQPAIVFTPFLGRSSADRR